MGIEVVMKSVIEWCNMNKEVKVNKISLEDYVVSVEKLDNAMIVKLPLKDVFALINYRMLHLNFLQECGVYSGDRKRDIGQDIKNLQYNSR